jgi:O-antigen ligase/polysaccharide polymerase Wzy-like membrane protein
MNLLLFAGITLLNVSAVACILKHHLPQPFPWLWAILFAGVVLLGAFSPLGTPERFYVFLALLSAVIVGAAAGRHEQLARALAIGLAVFVVADAVRLIPTADVVATPGELQLGGLVRRPYALEHPNVVAAWSLLLPLGPWTPIVVVATQSRGALAGLVAMLIARYVPRRALPWAAGAGAVVLVVAMLIRPGTMLARVDFWVEGLRFAAARPLTGWGSGSYYTSLAGTGPAAEMNAVVDFERTGMHTAHNAAITIAAENGLPGLVAFAGLAGSVFVLARRSTDPARWGLLAFWVQQFFDDQWLHPVTAVLLGLALAACLFKKEEPSAL